MIYRVSGRVTSAGTGLAGVTISDGTRSTTTGADGSYILIGVPPGGFTLTPSRSGFRFDPAARAITVTGDLTNQDFTATPVDAPPQGDLIQSIAPREGPVGQATQITVTGSGFSTTTPPVASLLGLGGTFALSEIRVQSSSSFLATVPASLPAGSYDLFVRSNGRSATLPNAFTVVASAPQIRSILPEAAANDQASELIVEGANFAVGASVRLGTTELVSQRLSSGMLLAEVPAGLTPGTYDVVVINPGGSQASLVGAFTVLDGSAARDDLSSSSEQLWLAPQLPRAGEPFQFGLLVQRDGGTSTLENVAVAFRRDSASGPLLGTASVPFLDPSSSGETTPLSLTLTGAGQVTLYAIIDPEGMIAETDRSNNVVSRTMLLLPAAADRTPPQMTALGLNGGNGSTVVQPELTLDVTAEDPPPNASGVRSAHLIEYVYQPAVQRWVPIAQSGWLGYTQTPEHYRWTVSPLAGVHYLQVRARDNANNLSLGQARMVTYEGVNDRLARGQTRIYRYELVAGQEFRVNVDVQSGDADLYVWSPQAGAAVRVSNLAGSADEQIVIPASAVGAGIYQVEVYGYSASTYRLTTAIGPAPAGLAEAIQGGLAEEKPLPTEPLVAPSAVPDERVGSVPPLDDGTTGYRLYLPFTRR